MEQIASRRGLYLQTCAPGFRAAVLGEAFYSWIKFLFFLPCTSDLFCLNILFFFASKYEHIFLPPPSAPTFLPCFLGELSKFIIHITDSIPQCLVDSLLWWLRVSCLNHSLQLSGLPASASVASLRPFQSPFLPLMLSQLSCWAFCSCF